MYRLPGAVDGHELHLGHVAPPGGSLQLIVDRALREHALRPGRVEAIFVDGPIAVFGGPTRHHDQVGPPGVQPRLGFILGQYLRFEPFGILGLG